jgi:hypothetical protein
MITEEIKEIDLQIYAAKKHLQAVLRPAQIPDNDELVTDSQIDVNTPKILTI